MTLAGRRHRHLRSGSDRQRRDPDDQRQRPPGANISFASGSQITGTGKVVFNGGAGNDIFTGTEAADTINGGAGNDTLNGGAGGT